MIGKRSQVLVDRGIMTKYGGEGNGVGSDMGEIAKDQTAKVCTSMAI
jgi:hypothetical protein